MGTRLLRVVLKAQPAKHPYNFQRATVWRFKHNPRYDVSATKLLENVGQSTKWPYYKLVAYDALNKGINTVGCD